MAFWRNLEAFKILGCLVSSLGGLVILLECLVSSLGGLVIFLGDGVILFEELLFCLAGVGKEVVGAV